MTYLDYLFLYTLYNVYTVKLRSKSAFTTDTYTSLANEEVQEEFVLKFS